MAQAADELARQGAPAFSTIKPMLNILIEAERAEREVRSINYQMRAARFPAYRDRSGFDFSESAADEALLNSLHRCDFIADAHNIVMIGGPGTGKTHLATAIGVQAITFFCRLAFAGFRSETWVWLAHQAHYPRSVPLRGRPVGAQHLARRRREERRYAVRRDDRPLPLRRTAEPAADALEPPPLLDSAGSRRDTLSRTATGPLAIRRDGPLSYPRRLVRRTA